jgi:glycosyltransferase involved in cell wall biosynthesis
MHGKIPSFDHYDWSFYNTSPRTFLERLLKKPNLARLSRCRDGARALEDGRADLLVSFLPVNTSRVGYFTRPLKKRGFHLAFTFNFTELPSLRRINSMKQTFRTVDRFIVYSQYEKELYSQTFDIPPEKFSVINWGVGVPEVDIADRVVPGDYICAIGGEGRDYGPLMEVAKAMPVMTFVLVARQKNLVGLDLPPNVRVFINIPLLQANNILYHSLLSVIPLRDEDTPCGLVTLIAGMHLGKASVATWSRGLIDYIQDRVTGVYARPQNPGNLKENIELLLDDPELRDRIGKAGRKFATAQCSEEYTVNYVENLLRDWEAGTLG